jgi:hypothetical protein
MIFHPLFLTIFDFSDRLRSGRQPNDSGATSSPTAVARLRGLDSILFFYLILH